MASDRPLRESDLLFPAAAAPLPHTLRPLKRAAHTITNRLRSIAADSSYIRSLARSLDLPLVANERTGSWYIPLELRAESACFKSADGHWGEWNFAFGRLNGNVLALVGKCGGCIIVDSTRRGKYAPDALSKTVPIWCTVLNRLLFPDNPDSKRLCTHDAIVSASEHSQIQRRICGFIETAKFVRLDLDELRKTVKKPLLPILLMRSHPDDYGSFFHPGLLDTHHPVYLAVASKFCADSTDELASGYIQGAGDDSEGWALGLTPELYWQKHDLLLSTQEANLPDLIRSFSYGPSYNSGSMHLVRPTTNLYVSTMRFAARESEANVSIIVCCDSWSFADFAHIPAKRVLHLSCGIGKQGSRELRKELWKLPAFMEARNANARILVSCKDGRDLSIGVALAILCRYTDDQGTFRPAEPDLSVDKSAIRRKLAWIVMSIPSARLSRATLRAVNSFLMEDASPLSQRSNATQPVVEIYQKAAADSPPDPVAGPS